ncbi:hypothetical protein AGLY_011514 [Aphis glycines]|uniref:Transposable element P transposase n=1 Tax=Aphis glycines TaxID=307491 RepID=A0A6G0TDZ1_APHGL|nr:hypothetical protein AGLY_011514 [Aphis glycines]
MQKATTLKIVLKILSIANAVSISLYIYDSKNITRVCPRLTKNHFELNNFSKMKVKFAVQIFSKSVANGITFYKNKQFSGFDDSDETIQFTLLINDLFDALNRKYPLEGIRKSSKDLEVLKYALTWLDEWHANLTKNLIREDEFLTISTAEGLKITIKSTIDLVEYLLNECGFEYVLSAKTNQDCLEKFFGIIRQVASPNDHPSTPSFLQLYRMLSVYCVIKPPKAGNCTILDDNTSPISVVDLKNVIVEDGQWELDDIFEDHDYYQTPQSTVIECVVHFLAGYLTKRLKISTKCEICIKSLNTEYGKSTNKTTDLNENRILTFPCKEHKVEILTNIFVIYITMRMRQFSYMKNQESKKQNKTKKKLSKLMNT